MTSHDLTTCDGEVIELLSGFVGGFVGGVVGGVMILGIFSLAGFALICAPHISMLLQWWTTLSATSMDVNLRNLSEAERILLEDNPKGPSRR